MKLWFNPQEPDWTLVNPAMRDLDLNYYPGEFHTSDLISFVTYTNGTTQRIIDYVGANEQRMGFIAQEQPGAWARNFHIPKNQKLKVYITARATDMLVCDFEFFLNEGSELELRYLSNAELRQTHTRIRVNHCAPNSRSDIRTATVAGNKAASTVLVDVQMPAGCSGSASTVKCYNWSAGGRVGSLPIITVAEPNVEATHGNVMYAIDREAVFLLQLRGLSEDEARGEVLYGQLIAGMGNEVDLVDWDEARECLGDLVC